jgi:hypothetical protein
VTHPVEFGECPACERWGQLEYRQDWTLYVHHAERVIHLVPIAPPAGTALFTACPDCMRGFLPRSNARLAGNRIVSHTSFNPCWRCKATGQVPGFVMPA